MMTGIDWIVELLFGLGVVAALRATVLLVGALAFALLMRRSSGSSRHALWSVSAAALLVLPFSGHLPRLFVPVPQVGPWQQVASPAEEFGPASSFSGVELIERSEPMLGVVSGGGVGSVEPLLKGGVAVGTSESRAPRAGALLWARRALVLLWFLGAGMVGAALTLGLWRARRAISFAYPVRDRRWLAALNGGEAAG